MAAIQKLRQGNLTALRSGAHVLAGQIGHDFLSGLSDVDVRPLVDARQKGAGPVS